MHQESRPVAVVIAAMSEELAAVADLFGGVVLQDGPVARHDEHHLLDVGGRTVALRRSGIGFTNATAAVAHCFHDFGAVPVISVGTAGGLMRGIAIGDVVVGDHYVNVNADATAFGYALGQVPGMPPGYAPDARMADVAAAAETPYRVRSATIGSSEVFVTEGRRASCARRSPRSRPSTWSPRRSPSSPTCTTCRSCRSAGSATSARRTATSSRSTSTTRPRVRRASRTTSSPT